VIVLGFDTSTPATAVAVRLADGRTIEARDDPSAGAHPGHATRLLDMAHRLLADAGIAWGAIERVAVGVGPGTFTGLRVGVATARGLAQSLSVELVGISSPRALAAGALVALEHEHPAIGTRGAQGGTPGAGEPEDGAPAAVLAVIDARRGEVFAAAYETGERAVPRELAPPRALAPRELASVLAQAREASGGAPRRWLAVGDGALRFRAHVHALELPMPPDSSALHRVSAAAVCALGACAVAESLQEVVPDYRRRPDAELALEVAGTGTAS
jgi:tRNA threonylcarbamoyladenosine biosynthesis protein TsaB